MSYGKVNKTTGERIPYAGNSGGGTSDYTDLTNKPSINNVTLSGNKTASDLSLASTTDIAGKQDKFERISYADWQLLTPQQQAAKPYYIYDYPSSAITARNVVYDNTSSGMSADDVQEAVDELKSGLTNLEYSNILQAAPIFLAGDADLNTITNVGVYGNVLYPSNLGHSPEPNNANASQVKLLVSHTGSSLINSLEQQITIINTVSGANNTYKRQFLNNTWSDWTSYDKDIEAIVNEYGAKNLLPNNATTQTINGVTFTVNADGSVTVNGTATATAILLIVNAFTNLVEINETLISHSIDNIPTGAHLYFQTFTGKTFEASANGTLIDNLSDEDIQYSVFVYIEENTTVNNITFYPMIRDARIADPTYVPYAMTNKELTDGLTNLKYHKIAESASTGTYADKLGTISTTYSTLSSEQKKSAKLVRNDADYFNAVNNSGAFSAIYLDNNDLVITCFRVTQGEYIYSDNGNKTDASNVSDGTALSLWVCE